MGLKGNRYLTKIYADIISISPLHIGDSEGNILIDFATGKPFLPGTSIAGTFRSYVEERFGEYTAKKYFGNGGADNRESKLFFYDSFGEKAEIEERPGLKIDRFSGSASKGHKLERQLLIEGCSFKLRIDLLSKDKEEIKELKEVIYSCLNGILGHEIQFGAYKSNGTGYFTFNSIEEVQYDLQSEAGLLTYVLEKEDKINILPLIKGLKTGKGLIEFNLKCTMKEPILIKGLSTNDVNKADSINIKNGKGDYIIPGSSFKGVLRAHSHRISSYLNKGEELVNLAFGTEKNKDKGQPGRVSVLDAKVLTRPKSSMEERQSLDDVIYNRIKIDKFTGGTMNGAKFTESPIKGDMNITVKYKGCGNEDKDTSIAGMLLLSLRDIAMGNIAVGSGNNLGRGRIKCRKMEVVYKGQLTEIDFENKTIKNKDLIDKIVNSFVEFKEA